MSELPRGLTSAEVRARHDAGQVNRVEARSRSAAWIFVENIFSLFNGIIALIVGFLLLYWVRTGDGRLAWDTAGVVLVALLNTVIAIVQELRAKQALDRVNLLLRRDVAVVRDGSVCRIPQETVVQDEVLHLTRGDQVVVDGAVLEASHLEIDESLLTGESKPILKKAGEMVLSGSFCTAGAGYYRAERVGGASYAATVTRSAKVYKHSLTPLQRQLNFLVKTLFGTALALVVLEVALHLGRMDGDGFLYRIFSLFWGAPDPDFIRKLATVLSSLVPQGLVLTASATFALGVYRISKIGAIVQKLNAVESFSNVQVICADKTGTLTENRLAVRFVTPAAEGLDPAGLERLLGTYARLSTEQNATIRALEGFSPEPGAASVDEVPFNSERKLSALAYRQGENEDFLVLGGFDILADRVAPAARERLQGLFAERGLEVYRNLLFGRLAGAGDFASLKDGGAPPIVPLAVVSIADQIRTDVYEALKWFEERGIALKILSGDSAPAVRAVCREIGWDVRPEEAVSGDDLEKGDESAFREAVAGKKIFARLKPDHKLRILKELRRRGLYTAMVGDGVNDLPAIKEAHLGIAMEEGSAITREVADIILLKNSFSLLPRIFEEGNRIVNTVGSVAKLFLTKNFMVIYLTVLSAVFLLDFPLTPRRVSLINVFAIGLPAFIIAFRNRNVLRPPRFMQEILSFVTLSALCLVGGAYLANAVVSRFFLGHSDPSLNVEDAQMVMLAVLVMTAVANFLAVALANGRDGLRLYCAYAAGMLLGFFGLALGRTGIRPLDLLKRFYEIHSLNGITWLTAILIGTLGAGVLIGLQTLRRRLWRTGPPK